MNKKVATITVCIMATALLAIGTLYFSGYFNKNTIDRYTKGQAVIAEPTVTVAPESPVITGTEQVPQNSSDSPTGIESNPDSTSSEIKDTGKNVDKGVPGVALPEEITNADLAAIQGWLERKIEEHKDEINEQDLKDFKAIIKKLDQPYIKELSIDGFTGEEQELLKAHLRERLTNNEYERGKELFRNYSYLLDELE